VDLLAGYKKQNSSFKFDSSLSFNKGRLFTCPVYLAIDICLKIQGKCEGSRRRCKNKIAHARSEIISVGR